MKKVSILIAVYNTEHYLRQCLDSLLNQTYKEIQIVCIDDASTDGSMKVLEEYERRDGRIVVGQNAKNEGQAKTRNHALEYADGDYVTMVDSDDWLSDDAIEKAVNTFEDGERVDSVVFDLVDYDESSGEYREYPRCYAPGEVYSGEEALRYTLDWSLHGLYVTRMRIQKAIPYEEQVRYGGDDNTTRLHYLQSREVRRCTGKYYYRRHDKSVTGGVSARQFDLLKASESMQMRLAGHGVGKELQDVYEHVRWHEVVDMYDYYLKNKEHFSEEERKEIAEDKLYAAWKSIDKKALPLKEKMKGLMVTQYSYAAFGAWVRLYRTLRGLSPKKILKERLKY